MHKIAVMGDQESIMGFMALGFAVFAVSSKEEAEKTLTKLAKEDYAVIYMTESVMQQIQEAVDLYKDVTIPAVIPIPGKEGPLGLGMRNVKRSVERAVGADILFQDK